MERDALTVFTLVWQLSPHTKCLSLGHRLACFRSAFVLASIQHSNWEHVLAQISYKFKSFQLKLLKHIPVYCNLEVVLSFICDLLWCISNLILFIISKFCSIGCYQAICLWQGASFSSIWREPSEEHWLSERTHLHYCSRKHFDRQSNRNAIFNAFLARRCKGYQETLVRFAKFQFVGYCMYWRYIVHDTNSCTIICRTISVQIWHKWK